MENQKDYSANYSDDFKKFVAESDKLKKKIKDTKYRIIPYKEFLGEEMNKNIWLKRQISYEENWAYYYLISACYFVFLLSQVLSGVENMSHYYSFFGVATALFVVLKAGAQGTRLYGKNIQLFYPNLLWIPLGVLLFSFFPDNFGYQLGIMFGFSQAIFGAILGGEFAPLYPFLRRKVRFKVPFLGGCFLFLLHNIGNTILFAFIFLKFQ